MTERNDPRDILDILSDPGFLGQQAIFAQARAEIERLRAAVGRLMDQPTMNPLDMTPDQRKELWAAHEEARAALEQKP